MKESIKIAYVLIAAFLTVGLLFPLSLFRMFLVWMFIFPFGYLLVHLTKSEKALHQSFFVNLPIYLSIGFAASTVITFLVSSFMINWFVVVFVTSGAWILLFHTIRRKVLHQSNPLGVLKIGTILPVTPLLFSFAYMALYIGRATFPWPQSGDPASHGIFTSLILYHQRIPSTTFPIEGAGGYVPMWYPLGFHSLVAFISLLFDLYPGEALLYVSASMMALIPPLICSIVWVKTRSSIWSLMAFLMSYLVPGAYFSSHHIATSLNIFSFFYNGVYPVILGNLLMLCLAFVLICLYDSLPIKFWSRNLLIPIFIAVALVFVYPLYLPFLFVFLILRMVVFLSSHQTHGRVISFLSIAVLIISFFLLRIRDLLRLFFPHIEFSASGGRTLQRYGLFNENSLIIYLSLIFALFLLVPRRKNINITLLYFAISFPVLLSFNQFLLTEYLIVFAPSRAIISLLAISYIVFNICVSYLINFPHFPVFHLSFRKITFSHALLLKTLCVLSIIILFSPTFLTHISASTYQRWNVNADDLRALQWIDKNVPATELILNDKSWASYFLLSASIRNVTNNILFANRTTLAIECDEILNNPLDYFTVKKILEKWDVKYVFLGSSDAYWDILASMYRYRPYPSKEYVRIFDMNPVLSAVYSVGNTRVYRVTPNQSIGIVPVWEDHALLGFSRNIADQSVIRKTFTSDGDVATMTITTNVTGIGRVSYYKGGFSVKTDDCPFFAYRLKGDGLAEVFIQLLDSGWNVISTAGWFTPPGEDFLEGKLLLPLNKTVTTIQIFMRAPMQSTVNSYWDYLMFYKISQ